MTRLGQSRVVVTGAASGLGRCMALEISRRGGALYLLDLDGERLARVSKEIASAGGAVEAFVCDVSDRRAVYGVASRLGEPVDVLINNAGVVSGSSFLEIPDEEIERSLKVNTLSLFWTTKAFLPGMLERNRGHLVTIASAAGLIGVARLSDYCASKWAAVGLDESLRVELKKRGANIKTTVVCPYFVDTGMFEGVASRFPFLLPILSETRLTEMILRAIEADRPRLFTPPLVHSIAWLRVLPVRWFDAVSNFMGINDAMNHFVGRK
ncbi:MAG TPA: SDR family oxidoreductase [Vicinamibacteria bacterium]|nr:SDR family oxidoreductase [Vicinamibacteria bacterium]